MQKVRISNLKTFKIELEDGSFAEIKDLIDYATYKMFMGKFKDLGESKNKADDLLVGIDFLKTIIVSWNFVDASNEIVPFEEKHVEFLDIDTISELLSKAMEHYSPVKKN